MNLPQIVAHRGYAQHFPENTLAALEAAVKVGARYVEFDVQLTADGVPVLLHDADLERTSDQPGRIFDLKSSDAAVINVGEPKRFGAGAFAQANIPTLASVMERLGHWPDVTAFVEIKEESLRRFGMEKAVKIILEVLRPALHRCVVISYDILALRCARAMGARSIGWVLPAWNDENHIRASELVPDYIFVNYLKVPAEEPLWRGPWRWAMYEVTDIEIALALAGRGVQLIETMAVGELLEGLPRKAREMASRRAEPPPSAPLPNSSRALPRRLLKPSPEEEELARELSEGKAKPAVVVYSEPDEADEPDEPAGAPAPSKTKPAAKKAHSRTAAAPAKTKAKKAPKAAAAPVNAKAKTKAKAKSVTKKKAAPAPRPVAKRAAKAAVKKTATSKSATAKRAASGTKKAKSKTSARRK